MITASHCDLAEMIERRAVLMHMAAHDHGNLAVWSHCSEGYFEVAHVAGLYSTAMVFRERSGGADAERQIDHAGIDRGAHLAQERNRSRAASAAGKKHPWRDADDLRYLFGPKRLWISGGDRHAQTLTVEIFETESGVFQSQM